MSFPSLRCGSDGFVTPGYCPTSESSRRESKQDEEGDLHTWKGSTTPKIQRSTFVANANIAAVWIEATSGETETSWETRGHWVSQAIPNHWHSTVGNPTTRIWRSKVAGETQAGTGFSVSFLNFKVDFTFRMRKRSRFPNLQMLFAYKAEENAVTVVLVRSWSRCSWSIVGIYLRPAGQSPVCCQDEQYIADQTKILEDLWAPSLSSLTAPCGD